MDLNKLKDQLQTEVDTAFCMIVLLPIWWKSSRVLLSLGEIEKDAKHMLDKVHTMEPKFNMPPSSRAKFQLKLGKIWIQLYN
jgi:hypothetical protein